jgi:uncharacterized protein (DUF736 family)
LAVTSDIVDKDESSEPDNIDHSIMGKVTYGAKCIRNQVTNTSSDLLNIIIDNPEFVVEVLSAFIDDSLITAVH